MSEAQPGTTSPEIPALTRRQQQVLTRILHGYSPSEIGDLLHLSKQTVSHHRNLLFRTLKIHRRSGSHGHADLVAWAIQRGLISIRITDPT